MAYLLLGLYFFFTGLSLISREGLGIRPYVDFGPYEDQVGVVCVAIGAFLLVEGLALPARPNRGVVVSFCFCPIAATRQPVTAFESGHDASCEDRQFVDVRGLK